jgi:hypothetical protein
MRSTVGRLRVQRRSDQLGHALVVDRARLAWADIVVEGGNAALDEARTLLTHRRIGELESLCNLAIGAAQNNPCAVTQP